MSFHQCLECDREFGPAATYCAHCGAKLVPVDGDPTDTSPGFLSNASRRYLQSVSRGETDLRPGTPLHDRFEREVRAAFEDFALIGMIESFNLAAVLADESPIEVKKAIAGEEADAEAVNQVLGMVALARLGELAVPPDGRRLVDELFWDDSGSKG